PEYIASYARRFVAAGARLVGGCCGTTPDHTRQIAEAVRVAAPAVRPAAVATVTAVAEPRPAAAVHEKSALGRALANGTFAVIAEVSAPRGLNLDATLEQARRFRDLGALAVNVPDYPRSGARVSAVALAGMLEQHGVDALLHCTCRDRTLTAIQS